MKPPRLQFTRTSDGIRVAYATLSDNGPPVLWNRSLTLNLLSVIEFYPGFETLASATSLTLLDQVGQGASQREEAEVSIASHTRALEAVADRIGPSGLTLVGVANGCVAAVAFAVEHPDRVSRLVCCDPAADPLVWPVEFLRDNWSMARRMLAQRALPDGPVERQRALNRAIKDNIDHATFLKYSEAIVEANWGSHMYASLKVPTLIVQHIMKNRAFLEPILAAVPHCELVELEGSGIEAGRSQEQSLAILEYMGLGPPGSSRESSGTAVILFADVVDSTAITASIGNAAFRDRTRQLDGALRAVIIDAGGSPVEGRTLGDGVIGLFTSAAQAIAAALQCGRHAEEVGLQLHLGIHAGDVIREAGGVSGIAVSIAARISDLTAPNEILVSATVRDLARASSDVSFEDRGERALKGIDEPVRLFAVV